MKKNIKHIFLTVLTVTFFVNVFLFFDGFIFGTIESLNIEILRRFIYDWIIIFIASILFIFINYQGVVFLNTKLTFEQNLPLRVIFEILFLIITAIIIGAFLSVSLHYLSYQRSNLLLFTYTAIKYCFVFNIIGALISESIIFYKKWQKTKLEKLQSEKEKQKAHYEALKIQLNPHFLFNNLSVLSSLIAVSPQNAEIFVNHFAKIYRYVLDTENETVVELKRETEFIKSYFNLLKYRFQNGIELSIKTDKDISDKLIPPLVLQILIENVVKHNIISVVKPIIVNIYNSNSFLIVENNIVPKNVSNSNKLGIRNITDRYSYLTDIKPVFEKTNDSFIVKIPLLIDN